MRQGVDTLMPNWALDQMQVLALASEIKALLFLVRHRAYRSNEYSTRQIAVSLDLDVRTIQSALLRLADLGLILTSEGRHCSMDAASKMPANYCKALAKLPQTVCKDTRATPPINAVPDGEFSSLNKGTDELMKASKLAGEIQASELEAAGKLETQKSGRPETVDSPSLEKNSTPGQGLQGEHGFTHPPVSEPPPESAALDFFAGLAGSRFAQGNRAELDRWYETFSPTFLRMAFDLAPSIPGVRIPAHAFIWLLNRERPWPMPLLRQWNEDRNHTTATELQAPALGDVLICGDARGRVIGVDAEQRLVDIQTGQDHTEYVTVPWASTHAAVSIGRTA